LVCVAEVGVGASLKQHAENLAMTALGCVHEQGSVFLIAGIGVGTSLQQRTDFIDIAEEYRIH
jgi:hypothetical protein